MLNRDQQVDLPSQTLSSQNGIQLQSFLDNREIDRGEINISGGYQ